VDEGDSDHWDALMNFLAANDISQSENYAFVKTQVDIENYIVYMIHCIYTGKTDWPGQNEYLWRPKTEGGIWRWAQYDMDQGLSPWAGPDQDFLAGILADDDLLLNILLGNAEFKQLFINYYADLMNTYFLTEVELAHFNDMVSELDPYMSEYQARWQLNQDWDDNKTFGFELLNRRWELRREQLIKNFGLSGSAKIELRVDPDMGNIAVNAILIDHDTPGVKDPSSWTGMYFKDVPIRVKAVPLPGFQFVRWESAVELDPFNPELVMILEEDISLRAIFSQIE